MTPNVVLEPSAARLSSVLVAVPGADVVACQHVTDVLRIWSLPEQVVDLAGCLVRQTVEHLMTSVQGAFDVAVEVAKSTVRVTVTGFGHGLFDGLAVDPLEAGPGVAAGRAVACGVRQEGSATSAWFSVAADGVLLAGPVGGAGGRAGDRRAWSQPRFDVLVRIAEALSGADTVAAVSDGVTGLRAYLGAAFAGMLCSIRWLWGASAISAWNLCRPKLPAIGPRSG